MAKSSISSKIPRIDTHRIFTTVESSSHPSSLKSNKTSNLMNNDENSDRIKNSHQIFQRSLSRDAIITKKKSSMVRKNNFSSGSNLHWNQNKTRTKKETVSNDDEQMIIDDEPIELVGGSVETLSDIVDNTYEVNGTFNVTTTSTEDKNTTYCKIENGKSKIPNTSLLKPLSATFDVETSDTTFNLLETKEKVKQLSNDKSHRSRLSTDLAEQMLQQGHNPLPGLNSTINQDQILLNISDVQIKPNKHSFNETEIGDSVNLTNLLCLPVQDEQNNDEIDGALLDETLVPTINESNITNQNDAAVSIREKDQTKDLIPAIQRFSLGLDLTEYTLDCSIELCDMSNSSSIPGYNKSSSQNTAGKQSSFEIDESLGILTPEQMKEFLDSTKTNTDSSKGVLQYQNSKQVFDRNYRYRVDLTPSPEELPLDPVDIKTEEHSMPETEIFPTEDMISSVAESNTRADVMTKSATSKISNSFIASITSVTSDGYQGDGEMSRPTSRGAEHSSFNGENGIMLRRQDPMTDSDFFTESDADDLNNRGGDRKAQVIDGKLFADKTKEVITMHDNEASLQQEDSCMESSGVFTDVESRANEYSPKSAKQNFNQSIDTETKNTHFVEKLNTTCLLRTNTVFNEDYECDQNTTHTQTLHKNDKNTSANNESTKIRQSIVGRSSKECVVAKPKNEVSVSKKLKENSRKQAINSQRKLEMTPRSEPFGNKSKIQKLGYSSEIPSCKSTTTTRPRCILPKTENLSNNNYKKERSKSKLPNKWDAVMNKITENQKNSSLNKKDLNEVKSKVYCGISGEKKSNPEKQQLTKRQLFTITGKRDCYLSDTNTSQFGGDKQEKYSSLDKKLVNPNPEIVSKFKHNNQDQNRTIVNGPTEKQQTQSSPNRRVPVSHATLTNRNNLPNITTEPVHPHKINHRNATIILESSTIIPTQQPSSILNNSNKNAITKTTKISASKKSPLSSSQCTTSTNLSKNTATSPISSKNNGYSSVNMKNLKNLSKKISTIGPPSVDNDPSIILLKQQLVYSNKGVEALGVLLQHLVYNLDAFSCPNIKLENSQKSLHETTRLLDETRAALQQLEARFDDRENYYKITEIDLKVKHQHELELVKQQFIKFESEAKTRIQNLEEQLIEKEMSHVTELEKLKNDADIRIQTYESKIREATDNEKVLLDRINELTLKVNEITEKAHINEIELSEKINVITSQMEKLKTDSKTREHELLCKLGNIQDDVHNFRKTSPEKLLSTNVIQTQSTLHDEVESLRCVLDIKQNEISELRKQNQEMQRSVDDQNALLAKFASAESRLEDLNVQLQYKNTQEQELLEKIKQLEEKYNQETKTKKRLSQHNEELQYRLKQNSEKFSATLTELSKSLHEHSIHTANNLTNGLGLSFRSQSSGDKSFDVDYNSPPTSPIVKGVVKKSDSVSWVLEMDDEAPEALASRVVRRAGSFRSSCLSSSDKCSQSPMPKRQKCQNALPLQTSTSATSFLRRNNSDCSPQKELNSTLRIRSKSVTTKSQEGGATPKKYSEVMYTSSPRLDHHNQIETDFACAFVEESSSVIEEFHRDKTPSFKNSRENRGLITCDTTKLLTNHCSTEKKIRKPKLSAGEALISGSNSEDESDSTQDSSSASDCESSSNCDPREVLSIEDALLKKIGVQHTVAGFSESGNNTPMDVSWSEHIKDEDQKLLV
uniref:CSON011445 protein n=1 Tax=Culicoides sonorensis TaxID=179676 RepID=A0A336LGV5_CULSO